MCWQCALVALTLHVACGSYLAHRAAAYHGAAAAAPVYSHGGYGHSGYSHGGYGYESPSYDYAAYPAYSSANTYQADYSSYSKPVDYYVSIRRSLIRIRLFSDAERTLFGVLIENGIQNNYSKSFVLREKMNIFKKFLFLFFHHFGAFAQIFS